MTRSAQRLGAIIALAIAASSPRAIADPDPPAPPATVDDHLARVRALYEQRDFIHARDELLAAYQLEPRPELLFALGQVEINLGHFAIAIDYYDRFLATQPAADQAALAEQAIGAARAGLAKLPPPPEPPPPPPVVPRPPPQRRWDTTDTVIGASGVAGLAAGTGLVIYAVRNADNMRGTLAAYNQRISHVQIAEWVGGSCLAAGALAVGGALLRWRLHLVDVEVQPVVTSSAAGLAWIGRW